MGEQLQQNLDERSFEVFEGFKKLAESLQSLLVVYGSEMRRGDRVNGEQALADAKDLIAAIEEPAAPLPEEIYDEFSAGLLDDDLCGTCNQLIPECDCDELGDDDDMN